MGIVQVHVKEHVKLEPGEKYPSPEHPRAGGAGPCRCNAVETPPIKEEPTKKERKAFLDTTNDPYIFEPLSSLVAEIWQNKMDDELEAGNLLHKVRVPINAGDRYQHAMRVVLKQGVIEMPSGRCYKITRVEDD